MAMPRNSSVYQVKNIEGKGLGCVASINIRRGSTILREIPQIPFIQEQAVFILWEAFQKMSIADQAEFMTLHDQYEEIQNQVLPSDLRHRGIFQEIKAKRLKVKSNIDRIWGKDKDLVEKLNKIYNIYMTNRQKNGISIKTSRFNHSCRANAMYFRIGIHQYEIGAISDIKQGEEITISYLDEFHCCMRNQEFRQNTLMRRCFFLCACAICKKGPENNDDTLEDLMKEVGDYHTYWKQALRMGQMRGHYCYPLEMCREEIRCYRKMYKYAQEQNMRPISLFRIVERAFGAASLGYQLYKEDSLKTEGENFAKLAEEFEKILGEGLVNKAIPKFWKSYYENFEKIMTDQPYGGVYQWL